MAKVLGFDPYARSKRLHPSMGHPSTGHPSDNHPSMQPAPESAGEVEVDEELLATVLELRPSRPAKDQAAAAAR